jgi:hypothetical protein
VLFDRVVFAVRSLCLDLSRWFFSCWVSLVVTCSICLVCYVFFAMSCSTCLVRFVFFVVSCSLIRSLCFACCALLDASCSRCLLCVLDGRPLFRGGRSTSGVCGGQPSTLDAEPPRLHGMCLSSVGSAVLLQRQVRSQHLVQVRSSTLQAKVLNSRGLSQFKSFEASGNNYTLRLMKLRPKQAMAK